MTPFKLICNDCGLSLPETATFLRVRESRAKEWWMGRRGCPEGVIGELLDLSERQDKAAAEAVKVIRQSILQNGVPEIIELGMASDDYEAQQLGWPTVGAHGAVMRRVIRLLSRSEALHVYIVPRGSTIASAAAR